MIVGQASNIQRPSEANLTPALVGGGRHVISCNKLWFSSSRNLKQIKNKQLIH